MELKAGDRIRILQSARKVNVAEALIGTCQVVDSISLIREKQRVRFRPDNFTWWCHFEDVNKIEYEIDEDGNVL